MFNKNYRRKFEAVLTREYTQMILHYGWQGVASILKEVLAEKAVEGDNRQLTINPFIDLITNEKATCYAMDNKKVSEEVPVLSHIRFVKEDREIHKEVTESLQALGIPVGRDIGMEDLRKKIAGLVEKEDEYIMHEYPRPSFPGIPFRLIRSTEGVFWTDINGNRVGPPDLDKIPTNPWVPETAKPFIFKTPDKNFMARRIALREIKLIIVRQHLDSALGEDRLKWGRRLGGFTTWQKRDRQKLMELR